MIKKNIALCFFATCCLAATPSDIHVQTFKYYLNSVDTFPIDGLIHARAAHAAIYIDYALDVKLFKSTAEAKIFVADIDLDPSEASLIWSIIDEINNKEGLNVWAGVPLIVNYLKIKKERVLSKRTDYILSMRVPKELLKE